MLVVFLIVAVLFNGCLCQESIESVEEEENPPLLYCSRTTGKQRFHLFLARICPTEYDVICGDEDVFDPTFEIKYRCQSSFDSLNNGSELFLSTMDILPAAKLLNITKYKDPSHRDACIVSLFYGPNCPFSARLSPAFNAVPRNFHPIKAVAVDATEFSRLNARYGITGTPTVILWVNGVAVARMDQRPLSMEGIQGFIESWTDLKSSRTSESESEPLIITPSQSGDLFYLSAALLSLIASVTYCLRERILDLTPIQSIVLSFGTTSDDVKRFMNGL